MGMTLVDVKICKDVPLNNTYEHTLYFLSGTHQYNYFQEHTVTTFRDVRFIKKNGYIELPVDLADANEWSYLWFADPEQSAPQYRFYFVTDVEAVSGNVVRLSLELDVIQTYMFRWINNPCFVEREHTMVDKFGFNTVTENLDVGELVSSHVQDIDMNEWCILLQCTAKLNTTTDTPVFAAKYDNIFHGMVILAVNLSDWQSLGVALEQWSADGKIDALVNMWMYPRDLVTLADNYTWTDAYIFKEVKSCQLHNFAVSMPNTVDGYTPRNKKVLQYPFNMLYVTNNNGASAVYHYELFGDHTDIRFNYFGTLSAEGVARAYPLNYKGVQHNYDEGLTLSGFPTCSWNGDTYKLWLAQNQNQNKVAMASAVVTGVAGAATAVGGVFTANPMVAAGGIGAMTHGVTNVVNLLAQKADMAIQPPQARGHQSGSLNMVAGFQTFTFMRKCVRAEQAQILDDFFDLYGYAVHRVKVPRYNNRPAWTYIKTRNACFTGNIPVNDLVKINQIFDNGVTWWKNPANFCDYSQDNSPST